jgi:hypothetical protein
LTCVRLRPFFGAEELLQWVKVASLAPKLSEETSTCKQNKAKNQVILRKVHEVMLNDAAFSGYIEKVYSAEDFFGLWDTPRIIPETVLTTCNF